MVSSKGELLIVDDNYHDRSLTARRFQRSGYEVAEASGGVAALELIGRRPFDLILLDIEMPDLNGLDILARVRSQHSPTALPIIMFTGNTETTMIVEALELGANDYLTKPLNFPVALARVQTQIANKQAQGALIKALEAADVANRAKSSFLANMSHELRTPLNAIIGFSEIIGGAHIGPINAKYREYADDIHKAGHHLLSLVSDLLDLSKIDAGRLELQREPTSLANLVRLCEPLVAARAREGKVTLVTDVSEDLPLLDVDQIRMKQILLNLLYNAVKFTPAGGRISLTAETSAHQLIVNVSDTGIGIRPEDIPLIMQPFRQLESGFSHAHEGTGLGLSIAQRLTEAHGGSLAIESQVGVGTTVTMRLPGNCLIGAFAKSA